MLCYVHCIDGGQQTDCTSLTVQTVDGKVLCMCARARVCVCLRVCLDSSEDVCYKAK